MSFVDFIINNHPDPDSLLGPNHDQLCKLAEEYAVSIQFPTKVIDCGNPLPPCSPNYKYGRLVCCICDWSE